MIQHHTALWRNVFGRSARHPTARGRAALWLAALSSLVASLACCSKPPKFADQPIVWQVDDTRSIDEPEERPFDRFTQGFDWFVGRRSTRALELRDEELAHNINALGEVPDSSWFTNRVGVRPVSPAEAAHGPVTDGPPIPPLQVVGGKAGGINPGVSAKDSTGRRFLIKFDTKDNPEMQTATNTIVNRIFWTLGYFVPSDTIFSFTPDQMTVAPGAELKDEYGNKRLITQQDVADVLALAPRYPDGHYRASASEFIPGIPKGGWSSEGRREDDPNDVIDHEHRREVRALRVFSAWLNHTDVKEDNTLDGYVEVDGKKFLRHYLIDFGEALGGHAAEKGRYEDGYENYLDWSDQSKATLSLGLWVRDWEHLRETRWPSIGAFTWKHFYPRKWKEAYPYFPFAELDDSDAYWAAKLILRFDRKMLRAIVEEGQLSHPEAEDYLIDALYRRREIVGRAYVQTLTALDHFSMRPGQLCAIDLSVYHQLVTSGLVEVLNDQDEVVWDGLVDLRGHICIPTPEDEGYHFYRLRTRRRLHTTPVMQVHFKTGKTPRVLGVVRIER